MNSREVICHPGEESVDRSVFARGKVTTHRVTLTAGSLLMPAVAELMDAFDCDSGVLLLDGAHLGPFKYVMPDNSSDELHAAWYSETHSCGNAFLRNATAIIGKRENQWWLHCHALWQEATCTNKDSVTGMGHLLPDEVTLATDTVATLFTFDGGKFDVQHDPETAFPLFQVAGGVGTGNAFIAKVYPHEDIYSTIEQLIIKAGYKNASIYGLGSLIGTQFENDPPMLCPISEVLIRPEATWSNQTLTLPVQCVDIEGNLFSGNVVKDGAPVLVTFELLIVETPQAE